MTLIIIVGRIAAGWISHFMMKCCIKNDISVRELLFINYGGMIRGAIAFGLVLKIPSNDDKDVPEFKSRGVVVTTTLAVVIITTVMFGSFMSMVQKLLVPIVTTDVEEGPDFEDVITPLP